MNYSVYAHGTSLHIKSPEALASSFVAGYGTVLRFKDPIPREGGGLGPVWSPDEPEPGTSCHISIPCTYTSLMAQPPVLESVTLLLDYVLCRIRHVHVYDGGNLIAYWNDGTESGPQRAGSPKPDPYWPEPKNNLKLLPDRFCSVEAS